MSCKTCKVCKKSEWLGMGAKFTINNEPYILAAVNYEDFKLINTRLGTYWGNVPLKGSVYKVLTETDLKAIVGLDLFGNPYSVKILERGLQRCS